MSEANEEQPTASAEVNEARQAFLDGQAAYEEGRFEVALRFFRNAYKLTNHPEILYNIATVADRLRDDEQALHAYELYLERVPQAKDREHVEGRIRVLKASLEEKAAQRRVVAELSSQEPSDPGAWPWIVVGSGAAAIIGGGLLFFFAQNDISTVQDASAGSRWDDVSAAHDRAPVLSTAGGVLMGLGVAAGLTGLGWVLLSSGSSSKKTADLRVSAQGAGVMAKVTSKF